MTASGKIVEPELLEVEAGHLVAGPPGADAADALRWELTPDYPEIPSSFLRQGDWRVVL